MKIKFVSISQLTKYYLVFEVSHFFSKPSFQFSILPQEPYQLFVAHSLIASYGCKFPFSLVKHTVITHYLFVQL